MNAPEIAVEVHENTLGSGADTSGQRRRSTLRPELPADRFLDRELSWLAFNNRVLDLAKDRRRVPLLERAKFLAIFASNLDEFFMVRVAGLKRRIAAGVAVPTVSGLMPREVHAAILARTRELMEEQARVFEEEVRPELASHGVELLRWHELTDSEKARMRELFAERIFPVLTPLAVDPSHPFPYISGLVDQPGRPGPQPGDRDPAVRPGQGADRAAALRPARRGPVRGAGGRDRAAPGPAVQRHAGRPAPHLPGHPQRGPRGRGGRRREPPARPGEGAPAAQGRPAAGAAGGRGRHRPQDARAVDQRAGHHREGGVPAPGTAGPDAACSR